MGYIYHCPAADENECEVGFSVDLDLYHASALVDGVLHERYYTPTWDIMEVLRRFRATIQSVRREGLYNSNINH
jgi:phage gp36-like protein